MGPQTNNRQNQDSQNQEPLQQQPSLQSIYPDPDKIKQDRAVIQQKSTDLASNQQSTSQENTPIAGLLVAWLLIVLFLMLFALLNIVEGRDDMEMFGVSDGFIENALITLFIPFGVMILVRVYQRKRSAKFWTYMLLLAWAGYGFASGDNDGSSIFMMCLFLGAIASYFIFSTKVNKILTH